MHASSSDYLTRLRVTPWMTELALGLVGCRQSHCLDETCEQRLGLGLSSRLPVMTCCMHGLENEGIQKSNLTPVSVNLAEICPVLLPFQWVLPAAISGATSSLVPVPEGR